MDRAEQNRELPSIRTGIDWSVAAPLLVTHTLALLSPFFFTPAGLVLCVVTYVVSGFGVTVGAHRYFAHASFATSPRAERVLTWLFLLSGQGSPLRWVRDHRIHHAYSDVAGDPHSPHCGRAGRWRGFWHAQLGWLVQKVPTAHEEIALSRRFCPNFKRQHPYAASFHDRRRLLRFHLVAVALAFLGGALWEARSLTGIAGGWYTGVSCVVWGIGFRSVFTLHVTSFVNSVTHLWGSRNHEIADRSVNNPLVAAVSFGEGWHNNHHRNPWAANHGFNTSRWEIDVSFALIYALGRLGLVWNVRVHDPTTRSRVLLFPRVPATQTAQPTAATEAASDNAIQ